MTSPLNLAAARAMRASDLDEGRAWRAWETLPPHERRRWRAVAQAVLDPSSPGASVPVEEPDDAPPEAA